MFGKVNSASEVLTSEVHVSSHECGEFAWSEGFVLLHRCILPYSRAGEITLGVCVSLYDVPFAFDEKSAHVTSYYCVWRV